MANKTTDLAVYAMNADTGNILWSTDLGRGSAPPAYESGMALIQNGVVYVGSPVTSMLYALDEFTGKILWTFSFANSGPAGAGRGNAVLA
jgi:outer membrane protein assembly factor BamB